VALGQIDVLAGRPAANLEQVTLLAQEAAHQDSDLLVLPELWLSGYDLPRSEAYAQAFAGEYQARWAALARETGLYMAGSVLAPDAAGRPANTALLLSPQGETLATYRKIYLFEPMGEKRYLAPGDTAPCFDLPWGRTALSICYDLRFPELFRHLTAQGAVIVLLVAQWPNVRTEHWRLLLRARAIENQSFLIACNRVGQDPNGTAYAGHSAVLGPWGAVLAEGGTEAALLLADLDMEEVTRTRHKFPVLEDRREGLYQQ